MCAFVVVYMQSTVLTFQSVERPAHDGHVSAKYVNVMVDKCKSSPCMACGFLGQSIIIPVIRLVSLVSFCVYVTIHYYICSASFIIQFRLSSPWVALAFVVHRNVRSMLICRLINWTTCPPFLVSSISIIAHVELLQPKVELLLSPSLHLISYHLTLM